MSREPDPDSGDPSSPGTAPCEGWSELPLLAGSERYRPLEYAGRGSLGAVYRVSSPLVTGFLGLPVEASEAFIVGFLRRDYGAAGLYNLAQQGMLDPIGIVVSLVTITLFVPCIANLLVMIKERGALTALYIVLFIIPFAFLVGGVLNFILRGLGVSF